MEYRLMKVIAFAATSSQHSINKKLATYAGQQVAGAELEVLDLNDYENPLFSEDKEKEIGQAEPAKAFLAKLGEADALVISFAEHNGNYSVAFKNLFDWCTRIEPKVFQGKPTALLATSDGGRGAITVLELAAASLPRFGADVRGTFSLPNFSENFDAIEGVMTNADFDQSLKGLLAKLS
jgi:NAD(P)H-dependent FMN reductase